MKPWPVVSDSVEALPFPSFGRSLRYLPLRYGQVLLRLSVRMLQAEAGNAQWSLVSIQLLLLVFVTVALNALGHRTPGAALHRVATLSVSGISVFGWLPAPFNMIVLILVTFCPGLFTAYPNTV